MSGHAEGILPPVSITPIYRTRRVDASRPDRITGGRPEKELALLLAGTEETRRVRSDEAAVLLEQADPARFLALLDRLQVTALFGQRLLALDGQVPPRIEEEVYAKTAAARRQGEVHELLTLTVVTALEQAGVRALPLKGTVLAHQLYGDVAARRVGDIDILVAAEDLVGAISAVEGTGIGWRWQPQSSRASPLPVLHERLTHPKLPAVEVHWRIHWYETRFAADALERAERSKPREPLIMQPADGLAALMLFYARDGFHGLKMAADIGAWWEERCQEEAIDRMIASVAGNYPALSGPLWVSAGLLGALVGLPIAIRAPPFRWRVAAELATPVTEVSAAQISANASLVDLLLAPAGGSPAAVRREVQKIPPDLERPLTRQDGLEAHWARCEHGLRVCRRWALAYVAAAARASRRSGSPGAAQPMGRPR